MSNSNAQQKSNIRHPRMSNIVKASTISILHKLEESRKEYTETLSQLKIAKVELERQKSHMASLLDRLHREIFEN